MDSIFTIVYSSWFLSEILLHRYLRSKKTDKQNTDKGSLRIIWVLIVIANFSAVFVSIYHYLPVSENQVIAYAGLALILLGMALRLIVVASLGKYFTVDVTIKQDHKLKKDGFYAYVRHPSYFASILSFIGFGISLNNWISLLIITVLIFTAFMIRIRIEEKALIDHFGSEYLDYRKKTKGLIPFIY
jgi:protein-S-isoprenylcysteine O-methyltransferase Ste14